MPNRIIREGLIDSDKVNQLSAEGERFYVRLMLCADDFGRFDGRASILKARLFPLLPDVCLTDVGQWSDVCQTFGLIKKYEVDKKPYLEILNFKQRTRAQKSKFPEPGPTSVSQRPVKRPTPAHGDGDGDGDGDVSSTKGKVRNPMWDKICAVFFLEPKTKSDKSRIGKVCRELDEKEATPKRVQQAFDAYQNKWPDIDCTPEALVKHWDLLKQHALKSKKSDSILS